MVAVRKGMDRMLFDRAATVAPPGYSRWMVPPAALAVHLSIGQAYAFSPFNLPMTRLLGGTAGDWTLVELGWIFSLAIAVLGLSAALFGRWVERVGPRLAMAVAALCFSDGFVVAAAGVAWHQLWLVYLGYGVLGGCGLGIGYISPVSTLIKWFPDRPGMATGMAIMGFGGGALVAAPLEVALMARFAAPGVWQSFLVLGALYLAFMLLGAAVVRVPPEGWSPPGWTPPPAAQVRGVSATDAIRTRQFWLLWLVLCLNVTAGIGVLGQASPMIQEMFPGRIDAGVAAGFVGLLSLFNMAGRFFWSSISGRIGRRATYAIFFALGLALYAAVPLAGAAGSVSLFVAGFALTLSLYGGGFATIPAYLRDLFGTLQVSAIHGRLLTAWSVAGVLGPVLVNYLRAWQIERGVAPAQAYTVTMYVMAALLALGWWCNRLIRPLEKQP